MTLREFLAKRDVAVLVEAAKCASVADLEEFLAGRGVTATSEEAAKLYERLSESKAVELSDEELGGISAGGLYYPIDPEKGRCPKGFDNFVSYTKFSQKQAEMRCYGCDYLYTNDEGDWDCKIKKSQYFPNVEW